jgi:hypothetical protein
MLKASDIPVTFVGVTKESGFWRLDWEAELAKLAEPLPIPSPQNKPFESAWQSYESADGGLQFL